MALPQACDRREVHHRRIDIRAYARDDGLYDVEAHLVDVKPFPLWLVAPPQPLAVGEPLHEMTVRLTFDDKFYVREVHASSSATPFRLCKQAESTLQVVVGERIASGWARRVKELLGGNIGCTHLSEMLITMATPALQALRGIRNAATGNEKPTRASVPLDSCFAYSSEREVVKEYWPEKWRPPISKSDSEK